MNRFILYCGVLLLFGSCKSIQPTVVKTGFLFEENRYFAQCHASTLAETASGEILASWFGGTHEGNKDVAIWSSAFDGQKWSVPKQIADGISNDTVQYACWNPVLFKAKEDNTLYLYYKVGPNPREWWGAVKTSADNGKTWSSASLLPKGILGPIKNKPLELSNGIILSPSSVEVTEDRWIGHVERSDDQQKSWASYPIDHNSPFNIIQPSIVQHADGRLQVLCRSKEGFVMTSWSSDEGKNWSALSKTNLINPNSATDAIRIKNGFLIVYNPDIPGKDWWEGRAKLRVAYSKDGITWKDILVLEDEDKGEFSYPTIIQDTKGLVHITYTYNRRNIKHIILKI
ncbi:MULTISPECIES: exo-alpha-sialidase [unclassified Sphingobacterium]|uniref:sialidase family protein n=1 Tax=unclassified Sphingobacterium TaxID=2609468 RepID=UPI0025EB8907|nr:MULTISPECIES: sialidase family protein [unclassified Sphingobacterium]